MKKFLLFLLIVGVYVLHQDLWNWNRTGFHLSSFPHWAKQLLISTHFINPNTGFVLGCLPAGLAYHAAYSIVAAIMMAILVKFAWPAHLEPSEPTDSSTDRNKGQDH